MPLDRRTLLSQAVVAFGLGALPACEVRRKPLGDTGTPGGGSGTFPDPAESLDGTSCDVEPITPNDDFYVTSYRGSWEVDATTWALTLDGLVSRTVTVDYDALQALSPRTREHTLLCISASDTFPAISNAVWTGLPLLEVFEALGITVDPTATWIHLFGADGYQTQIPASDLQDREIWLVWGMNGEPLPESHGFPARLLVPNRYGMKNPKWITGIRPASEPIVGTWEASGWSDDCTVRPGVFLLWPGLYDDVPAGDLHLVGAAFCGEVEVARVEVQIDDGAWIEAERAYGAASIWTLWCVPWSATQGSHLLRVRMEAADGRTSDEALDGSDRGGWGGVLERTIEVV